MLADRNAMATIAVKDLAAARAFYEGVLQLDAHDVLLPIVSSMSSMAAVLSWLSAADARAPGISPSTPSKRCTPSDRYRLTAPWLSVSCSAIRATVMSS